MTRNTGGHGGQAPQLWAGKIETREVLAAAYLGPNKQRGRMLRHAVVVNEDRQALEVLCRRVSLLSLADRYASDPGAPPTCAYCVRELKRRLALPDRPTMDAAVFDQAHGFRPKGE